MSEAAKKAEQSATKASRKPLKALRTGVVTSDRRDQTCTVTVEFSTKHAKYGKYIRRSSVHHVHDPANDAKLGDRVQIARCRPISKTKSWRLISVVERAPEN